MCRFPITCVSSLILLLAAINSQAAVTISRVDYHGWQNAIRMRNKLVELIIVPQIGRVMRYAFLGKENVLWENPALVGQVIDSTVKPEQWNNYGGDKIWSAPQDSWPWPPDPSYENAAHEFTQISDHEIRLTSPRSKLMGFRVIRDISLSPNGTEVTLKNSILNEGNKSIRISVWEIAQIDGPDYASFPVNHAGHFPTGYYIFSGQHPANGILDNVPIHEGVAMAHRLPAKPFKVGGDSPKGWIRGKIGGSLFTISMKREKSKEYPDHGCSLEVYGNDDPLKYVELELLGPLTDLPPGEQSTLITHWKLEKAKD